MGCLAHSTLSDTDTFRAELGEAGVERLAAERAARRSEGMSVDTKVREVLPLFESDLTIEGVAERLGIYLEAACSLVVASLRSSRETGEQ
jgi:hypothetical protein